MPFITKLDFSSNRQVKQYEKLFTSLSGGTQFGIPYSSLTKGPDITTTAITQTYTNLVSTIYKVLNLFTDERKDSTTSTELE